MLQSFLHLIGIDHEGVASLHWHHPVWLGVGLALLPVAAWWIIRRHRAGLPGVSPRARRLLSACRVGVLLMLVIVLGGPHVRIEDAAGKKAILAVLIDESASMALEEIAAEPASAKPQAAAKRRELVERAIADHRESVFAALHDRFDIRTYRFAGAVRRSDLETVRRAASDAPQFADESALGTAMRQAMHDAAGRPLAGMVLFSDGRWTTGPDPLSLAQPGPSVGTAIAPIFAVPAGSGQSPPDVAILDVLCPAEVARDDTATISATLISTGFGERAVTVRLLDGERELASTTLTLADRQPREARLILRDTAAPGQRTLRVAVTPQPNERITANNERITSLRVDGRKLRVLYLESAPRWDYRFLDHALRRDKGIDARIIMESPLVAAGVTGADLPAAAKLPIDAEGFAEYSVVMLGDISPDLFPASLQESLAKAVRDEGVGLIVQAGTQAMPEQFADGPLAALLPVKVEASRPRSEKREEETAGGIEAPAFAPFVMTVTPAGSLHPAFELYDSPARSRSAWSAMPPFYWAAAASQPAPGATVLAEVTASGRAVPLIAEHFAGRGRVLFVGTDSTYLWRRGAGDALFYRYWGQALRHVARRGDRDQRADWIDARPARAQRGETITIELYATDSGGKPRGDSSIGVTIVRDNATAAESSSLQLTSAGQPGHYRGTHAAVTDGPHRVIFEGDHGSISAPFFIAPSGRELAWPGVDRDLLTNLSDLTGGSVVELHELHRLLDLLPARPAEQPRAAVIDVWDHWLTLAIIVGLYALDVGIRRWAGPM